ncbi:hypothetical protein ABH931_001068 [Streptacidiphilus sp. MAP12-33]|uniref:hypothetical protein n=1 Tax=Streptacidiphilus sp. MAP12-33 TaxID=3156266 RepID=UPI003511DAC2
MRHVLTSKKPWIVVALSAAVLAAATSSVSAAPTPRWKPPKALHLDFSGDPQAFGGVGTVTTGKPATQVGMVYDLCNKDSISLRTDLIFCSGIIRLVGGDKGTIAFEAAAPRPGLAARYPIHFDGAVTGGTGRFKNLAGQVDFTQTGPAAYDVSFS